jgi:CheY-like chemotaxis protein
MAILFTSGYTENSIVHGGRLDPGVELLSKPYSREALARKIRHSLNNRLQKAGEKIMEVPILQAAAANASPAIVSAPGSDSRSQQPKAAYRILVVEDEMLIRMDVVEMLEELGHTITEAGSGEDALQFAEAEVFDILLTDLGLPKMTGAELAARLRERNAGIGVIFATGNNTAPELAVGAAPVLLRKPYDPRGLEQAVVAAAPR